jgi:cold shock CspA family protein
LKINTRQTRSRAQGKKEVVRRGIAAKLIEVHVMPNENVEKLGGFFDLWLPLPKGFGFIYSGSGSTRYFVHATGIISGKPQTGAAVRFVAGETRRGPIALAVEVLTGVK